MRLAPSSAEGCQREGAGQRAWFAVEGAKSGMHDQREVAAWVERWVVAALRIDTRFVSSVNTHTPIPSLLISLSTAFPMWIACSQVFL